MYRSADGVRAARSLAERTLRGFSGMAWSLTYTKIQPDEHAFRIRQIADDLPDRFRLPPHERGDGQNLIAARELWVLQQIDDLDLIASLEMCLADLLEIPE